MKLSSFFLFLLSCLSCLKASSLISLKESDEPVSVIASSSVKKIEESAFALEELMGKTEEELSIWLMEKRAEHDALIAITEPDSSIDFIKSSSGDHSPVNTPPSPLPAASDSSLTFTKSPESSIIPTDFIFI